MSNQPFRPLNHDKDIKAVQRIWIECGWIDDDEDERQVVSDFFAAGETEVGTVDGEAECAVHWSEGVLQYLDETLPLGAVTAVTTSHVARKLGFAKQLTARSLARQAAAGNLVSALGMFDQGFYDKVGYGTGPYETIVQFDPSTLDIDAHFRPPKRLTTKDYAAMHAAMCSRQKFHGAVDLTDPTRVDCELRWTEKPFGLGYYDGPGGTLSHFIWGSRKGEHGPYEISCRAYQHKDQLMELLALIKSLGDQVSSITTLEFGEFQLQDLIKQPFRHRRATKGGQHPQLLEAFAYWQLRILDLEGCLAHTHIPGPGIRFNLSVTDPVTELLAGDANWQGVTGDYVVSLGEESSATPGQDQGLPELRASINAFSRLWLGVRPASNLAISDNLSGDAALIRKLDRVLSLPRPHFGWDF